MSTAARQIVLGPILSEESQIQTAKANQYTFKVVPDANKHQIKAAIEAIYPVKVARVNTMNYEGKIKRQFASRHTGQRRDWKKAIVTLKPGDKIVLT